MTYPFLPFLLTQTTERWNGLSNIPAMEERKREKEMNEIGIKWIIKIKMSCGLYYLVGQMNEWQPHTMLQCISD